MTIAPSQSSAPIGVSADPRQATKTRALHPMVVVHWTSLASIHYPSPEKWMTQQEQSRLASYCFSKDASAFAGRRYALRSIVGEYLELPPESVAVAQTKNGALRLPGTALEVSLSFSRDIALIALSNAGPVGVDLEFEETMAPEDMGSIARTHFSEPEQAWLHQAAQGPSGFYRLWTAKEAVTKLWGQGLLADWTSFSVNDVFAQGHKHITQHTDSKRYATSLYELAPPPGQNARITVASYRDDITPTLQVATSRGDALNVA